MKVTQLFAKDQKELGIDTMAITERYCKPGAQQRLLLFLKNLRPEVRPRLVTDTSGSVQKKVVKSIVTLSFLGTLAANAAHTRSTAQAGAHPIKRNRIAPSGGIPTAAGPVVSSPWWVVYWPHGQDPETRPILKEYAQSVLNKAQWRGLPLFLTRYSEKKGLTNHDSDKR